MFGLVPLGKTYPPTKKLFHLDPYRVEADARVLAIKDCFVVLDQTIFYAESGGQDYDVGSINNVSVVDVQDQLGKPIGIKSDVIDVPVIQVDTIVIHKIDGVPDFHIGDCVKLKVDWDRRYRLMKNHSASHFLFHAVNQVAQQEGEEKPFTKGCHISVNGARFDFAMDIPPEWIPKIEKIANEQIARGLDITMRPEPKSNEIFYWTFGDEILIPCGGTHVRNAREIGPIKIKRRKQGRGVTRIGFEGVAGDNP